MTDKSLTKTEQFNAQPSPKQGDAGSGGPVLEENIDMMNRHKEPSREPGNEPEAPQNAAKRNSHERTTTQNAPVLEVLNIILTLIFSGLLVLFTWVSTKNSIKQGEIMRAQSDLMLEAINEARQTREVENRAYVTVKGISLEKSLKAGEAARAVISYENSGQTPATNAASHLEMGTSDSPALKQFEFKQYDKQDRLGGQAVIANGSVVKTYAWTDTLNNEIVDALNQGRTFLYVIGWVQYDDVFGKPHKTQFCFTYKPNSELLDACSGLNSFK